MAVKGISVGKAGVGPWRFDDFMNIQMQAANPDSPFAAIVFVTHATQSVIIDFGPAAVRDHNRIVVNGSIFGFERPMHLLVVKFSR